MLRVAVPAGVVFAGSLFAGPVSLASPVASTGAALPRAASLVQEPVPSLDTPRVLDIRFEGLSSFPPDVVAEALGVKVGEPLPLMQREQRIAALFRDYGIFVRSIRPEEVDGGVILMVDVLEFEVDLEPRFIGNASFDEEQLREWAGLTGRSELYLHEADGVVARLLEQYRQEGYHFAEVEWEAAPPVDGSRVRDLIFLVREGTKVRCVDLEVLGNESLPDTGFLFWKGGLLEMADPQVKGRGIFSWLGELFIESELEADLIAMRQVYRDGGWLDAEVQLERLEFSEDRRKVKVVIHVDEGPQYRVGRLDLVAVELTSRDREDPIEESAEFLFSKEELLGLLELQPGRPFEAARQQHDRDALRRFYGERGHLDAGKFVDPERSGGFRVLEPELILDPQNATVDVVFKVVQGRPKTIRAVEFQGNLHTRDKVLRREVSALPGELADLGVIERSLARIIGKGFFLDQQDPRHRPPYYRFRDVEGRPDEVDLEFIVEEGRVVDFQLSGGVASDSGLVGLLSVSHSNFDTGVPPSGLLAMPGEIYRKEALHGNGESISLNLSPGDQISFWSIAYQHPDLFSDHFDRWGGAFDATSRTRLFRSHDEDRTRVRVEASRAFGQGDLTARFGPVWQELDVDGLSSGTLPQSLIDSQGSTTFQGIGARLSWSQLDNGRFPREGVYAYAEGTLFGGPFGGDADLVKVEFRGEKYMPLGAREGGVSPVLLIEGALGVSAPYGAQDQTHYGERWFLGGSQRMRGFDFRGVGPTTGNYAVGGESMLYLSSELRWPLFETPIPGTSRKQEMFRGGPFIDLGILDPNAWELDSQELRASWGISFGLVRPLPLVFNLGWPLLQEDGDDLQVFTFALTSR